MDLRQSKNYAKYMESLGWIVDHNAFIKKLWFTSIIKVQHGPINLNILKKYQPFLIKIEPLTDIKLPGFKKDNWPLIPSKTIILDLEKIILSKEIRYEIRKAEKNNLIVTESTDPESFYKMLQETMKIGGWSIPIHKEVINLYKAFQPNNSVLLICHSGLDPESIRIDSSLRWNDGVAGCLLVWEGNTAHYMYAANTAEGRKTGAAYLILWEAIRFCQKKKLKYLDLEGIYDERYPDSTKNWKGFTAFKLQWGGKVVEYPGSYSKYCFPFSSTRRVF